MNWSHIFSALANGAKHAGHGLVGVATIALESGVIVDPRAKAVASVVVAAGTLIQHKEDADKAEKASGVAAAAPAAAAP